MCIALAIFVAVDLLASAYVVRRVGGPRAAVRLIKANFPQ